MMVTSLSTFIGNKNGGGGAIEFHGLDQFQRNNPSTFKGTYNLEGVQSWIRKNEKIF